MKYAVQDAELNLMSDIAMCLNQDCPSKLKCHRYTAIPSKYWQSYGNFEYVSDKCNSFIDNEYSEKRSDLSKTVIGTSQ